MKPEHCDKLDDYLGGWLDLPERAAFEGHLQDCPDCRGEIERQQRLDTLLAETGTHLEAVPGELVERVERHWRQSRRRLYLVRGAAGLGVAASVVLAAWLWPASTETGPSGPVVLVPLVPEFPPDEVDEDDAHRALRAAQQLALFMTSKCKGDCPKESRWAQPPRIPQPSRTVIHEPVTLVVSSSTELLEAVPRVSEEVSVLLSSARKQVSCILQVGTLGERTAERTHLR